MAKGGRVYIMANRYRGGTYVGVTADLIRRIGQHPAGIGSTHVANSGRTLNLWRESGSKLLFAARRKLKCPRVSTMTDPFVLDHKVEQRLAKAPRKVGLAFAPIQALAAKWRAAS